jgi:hypothetical protein
MMNKQLIAFTRKKVYVSNENPVEWNDERKARLITLTKELGELGYTLSPKAILLLSDEDMVEIHNTVVPLAAADLYPGKHWVPLYPGFPEQVISLTEKELWENQRKIYETLDYDKFLEENPWYTDKERKTISSVLPGKEARELEVLNESDVLSIFKSILASGNSITETTKEELCYLLDQYPDYKLPEEIPFKETLCIVMSHRPDYKPRTINDVLRYGLYLMGADPALLRVPKEIKETSWRYSSKVRNPEWRKLKAFPRSSRRALMGIIDTMVTEKSMEVVVPDAKRFYGHWLLLSERLHPGEFTKTYPKAAEFFAALKDNGIKKEYKTWYSMLQEKYNKAEDIVDIAKFIAKRPGELVRRFDSLIRRASREGKEYDIFNVFIDTDGMKNKTLTELLSYYDKRNSDAPRLISIKGERSKKCLTPLQPISQGLVDTIREFIERKILINIDKAVTEKDLTGKMVYIDPAIKNIPVPSGMRTNIGVIPVGTKIPIGDKQFIRMFIHWVDQVGREDLDLHAYLYKDEKTFRNVGWNTGLKSDDAVVHSGDVRHRSGDCSEFVDIDIKKALKQGWKYVVMDVCNYEGRNLDTLPNWLGYVTYDDVFPTRNVNWIPPKNVDFSKKIEVKDSSMAAWIFDIENRVAIFIGAGMNDMPVNKSRQNQDLIKFYTVENSFTTYSILSQYYTSRGATIVNTIPEDETELEILIKTDDIINDYTKVLEILG